MAKSPFTKDQQTAIGHRSGNLQLIACAGSGRTAVVVQRVANLLRPAAKIGASSLPEKIFAFTVTNKAAAKLKERSISNRVEVMGRDYCGRTGVPIQSLPTPHVKSVRPTARAKDY